jgi:hypothetical protein
MKPSGRPDNGLPFGTSTLKGSATKALSEDRWALLDGLVFPVQGGVLVVSVA